MTSGKPLKRKTNNAVKSSNKQFIRNAEMCLSTGREVFSLTTKTSCFRFPLILRHYLYQEILLQLFIYHNQQKTATLFHCYLIIYQEHLHFIFLFLVFFSGYSHYKTWKIKIKFEFFNKIKPGIYWACIKSCQIIKSN